MNLSEPKRIEMRTRTAVGFFLLQGLFLWFSDGERVVQTDDEAYYNTSEEGAEQ